MQLASWSQPSMGGTLDVSLHVQDSDVDAARRAARSAAARVDAWAARLTRFDSTSDLSALNSRVDSTVRIRPTLGAVLGWAHAAEERSGGVVSPSLLDERLAAESGNMAVPPTTLRAWQVTLDGRSWMLERSGPFRFDLDGFAKGWLADRAVDLLLRWPGVAVDADGDISFRLDPGLSWNVAVDDPRSEATDHPPLVTLRLTNDATFSRSFGVATSGTSVHRWTNADGSIGHHLIDRRTGRPAHTDIVQATVLAASAREAEVLAKSAVILGSQDAYDFLARSVAHAAVLLLESGQLIGTPGIERWLA
jgi:FAD:protein FMN transferase